MKKQIATSLVFLLFCSLIAQTDTSLVELEIQVGDSVTIGNCKPDAKLFDYLNYFKKTRFPPDTVGYDTATGNGFYASFFSSGDFDAKKLSCEFAEKRFAVLGIEELFDKKTNAYFTVLYLKGPDPHSVIWVDVTPASDNLEILFDE